MTKVRLLETLRMFTMENTKDLLLPVKRQQEDRQKPKPRHAEVYLMRLPDYRSALKKAPYIIHQLVTGKDVQVPGQKLPEASAIVRSVFCVYSEDEQEGSLLLLNLMERLRIALLRQVIIGGQFELDLTEGLETVIYSDNGPPPEGTAPYYLGEMASTWLLPKIKREVPQIW